MGTLTLIDRVIAKLNDLARQPAPSGVRICASCREIDMRDQSDFDSGKELAHKSDCSVLSLIVALREYKAMLLQIAKLIDVDVEAKP